MFALIGQVAARVATRQVAAMIGRYAARTAIVAGSAVVLNATAMHTRNNVAQRHAEDLHKVLNPTEFVTSPKPVRSHSTVMATNVKLLGLSAVDEAKFVRQILSLPPLAVVGVADKHAHSRMARFTRRYPGFYDMNDAAARDPRFVRRHRRLQRRVDRCDRHFSRLMRWATYRVELPGESYYREQLAVLRARQGAVTDFTMPAILDSLINERLQMLDDFALPKGNWRTAGSHLYFALSPLTTLAEQEEIRAYGLDFWLKKTYPTVSNRDVLALVKGWDEAGDQVRVDHH